MPEVGGEGGICLSADLGVGLLFIRMSSIENDLEWALGRGRVLAFEA